MIQDFDKALYEASMHHQAFIQMTALKGQFDPQVAAQHVQTCENIYIELLNTDIENRQVVYQLATLYLQTNRNSLAIKLLDPLSKEADPRIEIFNNLGAAYRNEHYNDKAREAFEKALSIEAHPDVLANLCALWVNEGEPTKGIPYGRMCLAQDATHKQGRWNLGLLLLENKEYEEGFNFYAQGFFTGDRIIRSYKDKDGLEARFWDGEDLAGKTIVLHGEQGIGDELLFMQFTLAFLEANPNTKVVLDVHPRLCTMIQRSVNNPNILGIFPTRKSKETPEWNQHIPVDYKDGMGSLPRFYFNSRGKYSGWLKPKEELVQKYKGILKSFKEHEDKAQQPVIGIAWTGGKKKTRVDLRSISLQELSPLISQDALFVSLEYPDAGAELEVGRLYKEKDLVVHHWPDVVQNFDYEHSVALAAACDLIICVNTSMVHVCGSMGHMCWTLTPHGHAWRYGLKDKLNPFYNTVVQYHQNNDEPWERVIRTVSQDLKNYIRKFK